MSTDDSKPTGGTPIAFPAAAIGNCPICKRPSQRATRPFCSPRCRDLDLGQWLNESYRVSQPIPPDELAVLDMGLDEAERRED